MERKRAVALQYEQAAAAAPRVVAKGSGAVAEAIVRRAREAGVPVHADAALTEALMAVEVDAVIPEELYVVVAQVLAAVYRAAR
ncbi:EscU/YscU/HrcU family type III secretion system export apparatus switch protein [Alicyclobacillus macrosporangiidus]|uniref:EscU/YscU/HrcU family type III secretion system export apparatus switch protein n=1 Tax=Alicyclobacillus macrosporangiidus TaxID=392015 RepID=UPI000494E101|nr:EscU/YscU/HrcU family type III secretion system export apparatus switch protein [Alicyclobacillus macrosporangiidus]